MQIANTAKTSIFFIGIILDQVCVSIYSFKRPTSIKYSILDIKHRNLDARKIDPCL